MKKIFIFLLVFLVSPNILAKQIDGCAGVPEIVTDTWPYNSECDCSGGLSKRYNVPDVQGFSLVAVCDYQTTQFGKIWGSFYFRGDTTTTGTIKHNEYASGANLWFQAPRHGPYKEFVSALTDMKFINEGIAFSKFRPPALTAKTGCWSAKVSLKVKNFLVILGSGDQQGNFPLKFKISAIQPYEACEPEA